MSESVTEEYYDFEQWWAAVVELFIENHVVLLGEKSRLDKFDWIDMYDDGMSPEDVLENELEAWGE